MHKREVTKPSIMQRKKGKMMNKYNVTGDEIVALLGKSESDDKVLDLFEKLEIDRSTLDRDELGDYRIELEEEIGLTLFFSSVIPKSWKSKEYYIGGQYLIDAVFDYYFEPLPFGLNDENNLEEIIVKLGKEPNYISISDETKLDWIYKDIGTLSIEFEDESLSSIYTMHVRTYEDPLENWDSDEDGDEDNGWNTVIKPYKR